jgi:homospermidine synthase
MVKVRRWTPLEAPYHEFLIIHDEAIGIPNCYTIEGMDGAPMSRPISYDSYCPCDAAVLSINEILARDTVEQGTARAAARGDP